MNGNRTIRILALATLVTIFVLTLLAIFYQYNVLAFPYEIDDCEGLVFNQAVRIAQGKALYSPIEVRPYILSVYTPLYSLITSTFVQMDGLKLLWPRLMSLVSLFTIGFACWVMLKHLIGNCLLAFVGAALIILSPYLQGWAGLCRVDMFAIALSSLGLMVYVVGDRSRPWMLASYALCFAALMTKQTMLAAPLAIMVGRFFDDRRQCLIETVCFFAVVLSAFFVIHIVSHGQFLKHAFYYVANPLSFKQYSHYMDQVIRQYPILIVGVVFFFGSSVWRDLNFVWLSAYLLLSLASTIGAAKLGGGENFWFEFIVASSMCLAIVGERAARTSSSKYNFKAIAMAVVFLQLVLYFNESVTIENLRKSRSLRLKASNAINEMVRGTEAPILTETGGWAVLNGKELIYDPFAFSMMHYQERWNQQPLVRSIDDGEFGLIVTQFDIAHPTQNNLHRFTSEMLKAMDRNYTLEERAGEWFIYRPNPN